MTSAITTSDLSKRYRNRQAIDSVDLEVPAGRTTVLLGPNGAGKTTLLDLIMGLRAPSRGRVAVLGEDPIASSGDRWRTRVGYVPQDVHVIPYLTGIEYLELAAELYGIRRDDWVARMPEALEFFDLAGNAPDRLGTLSLGTRKRVLLCALYLCRPELLVLDEPFEGLDPHVIRRVQDWLRASNGAGTTVLLSSHILPLVEKLADHVAILHEGRLRYAGAPPGSAEATGPAQPASLEALYFDLIPDPQRQHELCR
jgi:ABC-2 type transport system ATP-binding protein